MPVQNDLKNTSFLVNKSNLHQYEISQQNMPDKDSLNENEVLLKIDHFAFTSNNISYAILGEQIAYWKFFPTKEGWGIIPVWGFADVEFSKHPDIKAGDRFYGYYPMASHLLVKAGAIKGNGFMDTTTHRLELPPIYNFYFHTQKDLLYQPENESLQCLFRPLFTTSFLLDDFLAENGFFESRTIILLSASSKTALALAFLLHLRKKALSLDYQVLGLTSARNVDFVKETGFYDMVLDYDQISQIPDQKACIVDFAGNKGLQYNIQEHLQDKLTYNCLVGLEHWDQLKTEKPLANKGTVFFAPTYGQKRNQEWGQEGFQKKLGESWNQFIDKTGDWLQVRNEKGEKALAEVYLNMLDGKISPKDGFMLSF